MRVKPEALFAEGAVDVMGERARESIAEATRRLPAGALVAPGLAERLADRALPRPPRLGARIRYRLYETEIRDPVDPERTAWGPAVEIDVPFRGAAEYFGLRAGAQPMHVPKAVVRARSLILKAAEPDGAAEDLVDRLDRDLEIVRRELEEQRRRCEAMRDGLEAHARDCITHRMGHLNALTEVAAVLEGRRWLALRA